MLDGFDAVTVEVVRTQSHGAAQNRIQLDGAALRRHLAGKTEQILNDLFGSLRFLQNDSEIFAGTLRYFGVAHHQIGKTQNCSERIVDFMRDSGNQLADGGHFFGMNQFVAEHGGIGDVGKHNHDTGDGSLLVAHGVEVGGKFSGNASAADNGQFEIIDGLPAEGDLQGIRQRANVTRASQFKQRTAEQFPLFEAGVKPAAIGVTDQTGGVGNQNQALGIAENFGGEIALAMKFGLIGAQARDIEHESANLQESPGVVIHAEDID